METTRKTYKALSILPPNPEPKNDLIMSKMSIVVNREHSFSFDFRKGKKSVVEAVFLSLDDQDWNSNIWPLKVFCRRTWTVPDNYHLVQVGQPI